MCGYLGKISTNKLEDTDLSFPNSLIECRGPDNKREIINNDDVINYSLIFNRLSILDLSKEANQPLFSEEFNSLLMFNGEIYNHSILRKKLEDKKLKFKTDHSDSEVVLNGLSFYGKEFIKELRGQFSIFFLNKQKKKIILARDRLGQKPLYVGLNNNELAFGSNFLSVSKIINNKKINEFQIYKYLNYGVISSPNTIYNEVIKLSPAEILEIDYSSGNFKHKSEIYWSPEDFLDNKKFNEDEFLNLFSESVAIRANADVPVANFLSGGLDSSSIVKNLHDNSRNINSFSVTVDSEKYDESIWSKKVADKYDTSHKTVLVSSKIEFEEINQSLMSIDEPYADPSVVPSFLLSKEISKYYKVAISGDGGDELLGGYYRTNYNAKNKNSLMNLVSKFYPLYPSFLGTGNFFLAKSSNLKTAFTSFLEDRNLLYLLGLNYSPEGFNDIELNFSDDKYKNLLLADYKFYLPEMMMFKIDRTSMASSLEVRSPFVDHELIEYIISHSYEYYDSSRPKSLLQDYLGQDFNFEFTNRRKKGFSLDIEKWIYNNIDIINDYIENGTVVKSLNPNIIKKLSINKSRINSHRIWKLFVLEHFLQRT